MTDIDAGNAGKRAQEPVDPFEDMEAKKNAARAAAELIKIGPSGITAADYAQLVDRAKWMAQSREAVPAHLRGNVGMCVAIHDMAMDWGLRPYQVAGACYVVNNRLAFEAGLYIAVVNKRGGLKQRLRPEYVGEGDDLVCVVRGHFEDELEPVEYRSPPISQIHPKNSPLWKVDPRRQLFYWSARAFAKQFCQHVMLGITTNDEQEDAHVGPDHARDVTPANIGDAMRARLVQAGEHGNAIGSGYHPAVVDAELAQAISRAQDAGVKPGDLARTINLKTDLVETAAEIATAEAAQEPARTAPETAEVTEEQAARAMRGEARKPGKRKAKRQTEKPEESEPELTPEQDAYVATAIAWIEAVTEADAVVAAKQRWNDEYALREQLALPVNFRISLQDALDERCEQLLTQ